MIAIVNLPQNLFPIEIPNQGTNPYLLAIGVTLIRHMMSLDVCRLSPILGTKFTKWPPFKFLEPPNNSPSSRVQVAPSPASINDCCFVV